ncbi:cytochrome c1 [Pseudahrensia aquimaris]|uniref:Cytochrome c1 n=1 Tax=Pseudahrensia aquimaris TaxID=744461 RepID=A0ABW3FD41_9HYPH
MTNMFSKLMGIAAGALVAIGLTAGASFAASGYPINKPRNAEWSFAGPFGTWDQGALQRGFKVYREVCSACHGMKLIYFRDLADLGYSEDQIKAIAAEYEVQDGPNEDGEMFERPARAADRIPSPYSNVAESRAANGGAYPPDLSLIAKARAPERGFPTFIFDILTMYAENGPDYIYSLLTGYKEAPEGEEILDGLYYNPYFVAGKALAMANPLSDDIVDYDDGTPQTVEQYSKDVSHFLMWAAEPGLVDRKRQGFVVLLFLLIFAGLLYFTKKKIWANVQH